MTIAIGCDHAGVQYKDYFVKRLTAQGHQIIDKGTYSTGSVDYPDFVHPVADLVESGEADQGILICGSANGVAMTANKHKGIRAGIAWKVELAKLTRQHNDANIICIPARFVSRVMARNIVDAFLTTEFEGGRHQRRVDKISC